MSPKGHNLFHTRIKSNSAMMHDLGLRLACRDQFEFGSSNVRFKLGLFLNEPNSSPKNKSSIT